jgi:hypothetical protein
MIRGEIARTDQNSNEKTARAQNVRFPCFRPWLVVSANNHPTDGTQVPTISFA